MIEQATNESLSANFVTAKKSRPSGFTVWFTGLPAAGKSTLAQLLRDRLDDIYDGYVEILDGDEIRKGLSKDLGLSKEDREEHARRVSYVAKVLSRNGVVAIVALISPYRKSREFAKELIGADRFVEVFVKASLETCRRRDPKGLYAKAEKGEITNLTGLQEPYEEPLNPDVVLDTERFGPNECVEQLVSYLLKKGLLSRAYTV
ncbi:MAG: adenylyl-sulfate kinase [Conexivisphaerales archaeon]